MCEHSRSGCLRACKFQEKVKRLNVGGSRLGGGVSEREVMLVENNMTRDNNATGGEVEAPVAAM
jgi:hypothetical protein